METFRAFRLHTIDDIIEGRLESLALDDIDGGDVLIRTAYSAVNYKDAMAAHGIGRNVRADPPCIGGIEMCGVVVESDDPAFAAGDKVMVASGGLGVSHDGGFAEYLRSPADWIVAVPEGLTLFEAMGMGAAGLTAALSVLRMEANGLTPDKGPVAVSGATGGVGSLTVDLLAKRGYQVTAITGKNDAHDYLRRLGASEVLSRHDIEMDDRPLAKMMWAGAVDTVGRELLVWLIKTTRMRGSVALCGGTAGFDLNMTVLPSILRGVDLLGINVSRALTMDDRRQLWRRLATDLRPVHLDDIVRTIPLEGLPGVFDDMIDAAVTGRVVVDMAAT